MYVDVHSHLTHKDFAGDLDEVIKRATEAGLTSIIVNGLEPESNRRILQLAETYPVIKPALGIYPIDAINHLQALIPFPVKAFDVDAEIAFIESQAKAGSIIAIGECGLDGHWVGTETFAAQERVFEALIEIAVRHDLPLIIHTRKLEERAMQILAAHRVTKVDFHCYCGRSKMAIEAAQKHGWYFSIPANARRDGAFQKLLKELPEDLVLTETDCPYLPPEKGQRNEPRNVVGTIDLLSELRGWSVEQAREKVWTNYQRLFQTKK
ncbi:MAG: TatD family hydrolase [Chitinophagaceae bacterium]|nr:TatD family hydrolase [Oligoflexus sp.]